MTYSDDIPEQDRETVENELDDKAQEDMRNCVMERMEKVHAGLNVGCKVGAQIVTCAICNTKIGLLGPVVFLDDVSRPETSWMVGISVRKMEEALDDILNHYVAEHTNGFTVEANLVMALYRILHPRRN